MLNGLVDYLKQDERTLVEAVRSFAASNLLALDRACDQDESSVCQALPGIAELGLLNLLLPPEVDGLGCSRMTYAAIIHELAAASPAAAVTVAVHNMVGEMLWEHGSVRIRRHLLPQWGRPESLAAFAISEPDAGSDPSRSSTRALRQGDRWVLRGSKMWISNGLHGRWFVTLVQTRELGNKEGMCMILVDGAQDGVERIPIHGKMGIRGSETVSLHFTDAAAALDHLVGEDGAGLKLALGSLDGGRIGIAAQSTGIAEACLREMISYARQRQQFGQPIGRFQAIQQMVADSAVELEASKALIARACQAAEAGRPHTAPAARAKLYASETASRVADRAVQVHGGAGYVRDCRVEQLYRDARVTRIYEGTSEIQRLVIARDLLTAGTVESW
jgi:alkylation response protein AidB-like acyl-CoA dehydrogenase